MSEVFIVGGAGNLGRRLCKSLVRQGHTARPMYRHSTQETELLGNNIHPIQGDLLHLSPEELAQMMLGSDAVVFTAGAGDTDDPTMTQKIDGDGLSKVISSAKIAGIERVILVSAFPEASRDKPYSASRESYLHVKKMSEVELSASDLDWVIVRAGILNDNPGIGKVRANQAVPFGNVTRDDVAAFLAEIIPNTSISRTIIEVTEGDELINDAVGNLAK